MRHTVSERRKKWFFIRSMVRAFWEHLDKHRKPRKARAVARPLFAEALEPRVLFSATPAPVEPEQEEVQVDEAPVAQEAEETGTPDENAADAPPALTNAIQFDGVNDSIVVTDSAAFDVTTKYTFESWVKVDAYGHSTFISKFEDDGNNRGWMINMGEDDPTKLSVVHSAAGTWTNPIQWNSGWTPDLGSWYHVAVVFDSTLASNQIKLYVNGNLQNQTNWSHTLTPNNANLYLGGYDGPGNGVNGGANSRFLNGGMDDTRLWNTALTQTEIQARMNSELEGTETGLVGYWKMNEGTAGGNNAGVTSVTATTGANGTLVNSALSGTTSNWVAGNVAAAPTVFTTTLGSGANLANSSILDGTGGRTNIEKGSVAVPAGTHDVGNFAFNLGSTGGTVTPFLAVLVAPDTYQPIWVGAATTPTSTGIQTIDYAPGTQQFTLASGANVYAGFTQTGDARVRMAEPGGPTNTAHHSGALTPVAGVSLGAISHPDLTRNYAFQINLGPVAPTPTTEVMLSGGNLSISDTNGGNTNDNLTLRVAGTNFRITDVGSSVDQTIAIADVTGNITVNGSGGDDTFTIDLSGGPITRNIVFNGGTNGATGDKLVVTGGSFGTVTYDATNATNGVIDFGTFTVTFTGLEPVDLTGSTIVGDLVVNVDPGNTVAGGHTTTVSQDAVTSDTLVTISGGFESILFRGLTGGSLIINGEAGFADIINVTGLGTSFAGGLTINGGTGVDAVSLSGSLSLGGPLAVTADSISLAGPSITSTGFDQTYTGPVTLTSGVALTASQVFFPSTVNLGANELSVSVTGTSGGVTSVMSGVGGSLTKLGSGSFTLGTSNTYTGGTTVGSGASGGGTLRLTNNNALGTGGITLTGTGSTVDLGTTLMSVGNTLTIADGGDNKVLTNTGGGATTWAGNIIVQETTTGNFDVNASSGRQIHLTGVVSSIGAAGIEKTGNGTVVLANDNTYTGVTTISGGTLQIGNAGATGSLGSGNVVNNGILSFNRSGVLTVSDTISGIGSLVKNGTGLVTLSGPNTYNGTTTVNTGVLRASHNTALGSTAGGTTVVSGARLELSGGITVTGESLSIAGSGINGFGALQAVTGHNVWNGSVLLTEDQTRIGSRTGASNSLTVAGAIDDGPNSYSLLIRNETSSTKTVLSGASSYGGDTYVAIGTLQLSGGNNRLPTGTVLHVGNSGNTDAATFDMNGLSQQVAGLVGLGTTMPLTVTDSTGTGTLTVNKPSGTDTYRGDVSGGLSLTKSGAGTLTLSGTNTYTGATSISGGILDVDGTHSGGGAYSIAALATLRGSGTINANIAGAPGSFILSDGNLTLGNSASTSGFDTNGTLTVGMGHVVTINDQNAALLGISTVVNGTLQRPTNGGIFSLESGDVLSGSGSVTGVITTNSGSISPGNSGAGVLVENGNLNLANGTLVAQINGSIPGTQHDQVSVTGTVNITDANLVVTGSTITSSPGQVIVLIDNDGTESVTGTFNRLNGVATTLSEGAAVLVNGVTFYLSYLGGTGNDVTLTQAGPAAINADGAGLGNLIVRKVGDSLVTYDDGNIIDSRPFASVTGQTLTINGTAGNNETLTVDYATGSFFNVNIIWNGGAGGDDGLIVLGTGAEVINYTPSSTTSGNGVLTVGSNTITFTGLEPIDVVGAASFTLTLPGANDVVSINAGTTGGGDPALVLSGTSGGVGFELANVRNVGTVIIDTTASDGSDTISIVNANNTHGNTNLQIITGNSGTDSVTLSGTATFAGDVLIQTGTIDLTGGTLTAANATFRPQSGATVGIGGGAGTFNLTQAELTTNLAVTGTVTIGSTTAGTTTIGALNVGSESYHLEILSGTQISQTGDVTTPKNVTIRANQGNSGAHDFDMSTVGAGVTLFTNGGDILIEVGNAAGASITTLRQLTASGNVTVTTGGTSAITYGGSGAGIMAGGTVSLTSAKTGTSAITGNGVISATGDVTLQAAGDIAVNAAINSTMGKVDVVSTAGTVLTAAAGDIMASTSSLLSGGTAVTLSGDVVVAAAGGVTVNSAGAITINALVDAGSGLIDVNANNDGSGASSLTVAETATLTTTNATAAAIDLRVNTGAGGTGGLNLGGSLTTGTGGGVAASTDTLDAALAGTLVVYNTTINTGTGGTVTLTADDELWIGPGTAKTLTMTGGALTINTNADGGAASNQDRFYMFTGSAIAGTASSVVVNINNSQSESYLAGITAAAGAAITVNQTGTGSFNFASGTIGAAGSGDVTFNADGGITISGTINAGSGLIDINANDDGSGGQNLIVNETASLTTTNASASAIDLRVNTAGGGTGGLNLGGSLTTGTGGGVTVSTDTLDSALAGTLVVNNTTINTGTGGTVTLTADDELWIGSGGPGKTLTMTGGALTINANADGGAASNQDRFYMFTGSAIAGTASSVIVNINNSQSQSYLASITGASGTAITVNQTGSGSFNFDSGTIGTAGSGDVTFNADGGITISGTINAGSGLIDVNANDDGSGNQGLTINESAVLTTTNNSIGGINAIDLRANLAGGGTGSIILGGSFTTGTGGGIVVSNETGLAGSGTAVTVNTLTVNPGAGGKVTITADDELFINTGKIVTVTEAGEIEFNANADNADGDRFYMFSGAGVAAGATGAAIIDVNVGTTTGNSEVRSLQSAAGGTISLQLNGTGSLNVVGGTITASGAGNVEILSQHGIGIAGTVDAGSGKVIVTANNDGAGAGAISLSGALTTTSTAADAITVTAGDSAGLGPDGSITIGGSFQTGSGGSVVIEAGDNISVNNSTVTVGATGSFAASAKDEFFVNGGQTFNVVSGGVTFNANDDDAGGDRFYMFPNAAVSGDASSLTVNVGTSSGISELWSLDAATDVDINVNFDGTGTLRHSGGTIAATGSANVNLQSNGGVDLRGTISIANGVLNVDANMDGSGNQALSVTETAVITTANAGANAIDLRVNTAGGGTGSLSLGGSLTTGAGGTITANNSTPDATAVGFDINNVTFNTGVGGTTSLTASDEFYIQTNKTLSVTGGVLSINANADATGTHRFYMFSGAAINSTVTTADAVAINVGASTGTSEYRNISVGNGGGITVTSDATQNLTLAGTTMTATNGTIDLVVRDLNLAGNLSAVGGTATLRRSSVGTIGVFNATAFGDLQIDQGELNRISAGTLNIGGNTAGTNNSTLVRVNGVSTTAGVTGVTRFTAIETAGSDVEFLGANSFNSVEANANDLVDVQAGASIGVLTGTAAFNADVDDSGVGNFQSAAGASVNSSAGNGNVTINAADFSLAVGSSISSGSGNISFLPTSTGRTVELGGSGLGLNVTLSDAELDTLTSTGIVYVGDSSTGNITISDAVTPAGAPNFVLTTPGTVLDASGAVSDFTGSSLVIDGDLQSSTTPGVGILQVTGSFTFASNNTFTVDLQGNAAPVAGTHYDQVNVTPSGPASAVTIGSNVILNLVLSGSKPAAGVTYTLVDNGTANPVTGRFVDAQTNTVLDEGDWIDQDLVLYRISYVGGSGNDVVLTSYGPVETSATLDGNGNLLINDIETTNTNDTLTFTVVGNNLRINDPNVVVGFDFASPNGSVRIDEHTIDIPLAAFNGLIVDTGAGNDSVTFADFSDTSTFSNFILVDGGTGTDTINFNADYSGTGVDGSNQALELRADTINVGVGADVAAAAGTIELLADRNIRVSETATITTNNADLVLEANSAGTATGNFAGIHLGHVKNGGADLTVNGSGNLTLTGRGGTTDASNLGIYLTGSELDFSAINVANGTITITGTGGTGTGNGEGVTIYRTNLVRSGAGALTISGTGGNSGNTNYGVHLNFDSTFASNGGSGIVITGQAGNGVDNNTGVLTNRSVVLQADSGSISITGTGSGSGGQNAGVNLLSTTVSSPTTVVISGTGSATGSGILNVGAAFAASSITAGNGNLTITGTAGTGTSENSGVTFATTTVQRNGAGVLTVSGTGAGSGSSNYGVSIDHSSSLTSNGGSGMVISGTGGSGTDSNTGVFTNRGVTLQTGSGPISITGIGGGTGNGNAGVNLISATVNSATSLTISGTGSAAGTGILNAGAAFSSSALTATNGDMSISGQAGTGTSENVGVSFAATAVSRNGIGTLIINGTGNGSTSSNHGVLIDHGSSLTSNGGSGMSVTGQGAAGSSDNHGISTNRAVTLSTNAGGITLVGTGAGSGGGNVGVSLLSATLNSAGLQSITGTGSQTAAGGVDGNSGVVVSASSLNTTSSVSITGNGGRGQSNNRGIAILGISNISGGTVTMIGTANGATTGVGNAGIWIDTSSIGSSGLFNIEGTGGGGTGGNHGIFMNAITNTGGAIGTTGVAGSGGTSLATAGDFFP